MRENNKHTITWLRALPLAMMLVVLTACTSIDCPLNNLVKVNLIMKGESETIPDTIFITAYAQQATTPSLTVVSTSAASLFPLAIRRRKICCRLR